MFAIQSLTTTLPGKYHHFLFTNKGTEAKRVLLEVV